MARTAQRIRKPPMIIRDIENLRAGTYHVLAASEVCFSRVPLPKGEGGAKHRVRGEKIPFFTPHPPLRVTLSLRERDSTETTFKFSRLDQFQFFRDNVKPMPQVVTHRTGD
jgi:hypothetical protein